MASLNKKFHPWTHERVSFIGASPPPPLPLKRQTRVNVLWKSWKIEESYRFEEFPPAPLLRFLRRRRKNEHTKRYLFLPRAPSTPTPTGIASNNIWHSLKWTDCCEVKTICSSFAATCPSRRRRGLLQSNLSWWVAPRSWYRTQPGKEMSKLSWSI